MGFRNSCFGYHVQIDYNFLRVLKPKHLKLYSVQMQFGFSNLGCTLYFSSRWLNNLGVCVTEMIIWEAYEKMSIACKSYDEFRA